MTNVTVCVDTYLDTLRALRQIEHEKEQKRIALINTIAMAEAELAKPEYFGYLIAKDKVGYLETLSKTKTIFRGINPHDPLNGIIVNGAINPDFLTVLEEKFFRGNRKKIRVEDLRFAQYEGKRDKIIAYLKHEFARLNFDEDWIKENIKISSKDFFDGLQDNSLMLYKADDYTLCVIDLETYMNKAKNNEIKLLISQKSVSHKINKSYFCNISEVLKNIEEKKKMLEKESETKEKEQEMLKIGRVVLIVLLLIMICAKLIKS